MARLVLIEGPAGSGKSQEAARMLAAGEAAILADLTALWAAMRGFERDADGKYPVRTEDDPALRLSAFMRAAVVRQALREGLDTIVTSGTPSMATRWALVAQETGSAFEVRTIDPGQQVVRERLAVDGVLSSDCEKAVSRWYRN